MTVESRCSDYASRGRAKHSTVSLFLQGPDEVSLSVKQQCRIGNAPGLRRGDGWLESNATIGGEVEVGTGVVLLSASCRA